MIVQKIIIITLKTISFFNKLLNIIKILNNEVFKLPIE